ncbi:MAG: dephospho-CoA kinase [Pseudomonadota bacterium]
MSGAAPPRRALRVGLTGGIATGKSAVGDLLAAAGIPVIRADDVGHAVLAADPTVCAALAARYGDGILGGDGRPDRAALAGVVFRNPAERRFLEGLLHPLIRVECMRRIAEHDAAGAEMVVVEAALIVEAGWRDAFDRLVVVTCPQSVQLARVKTRDGVDEETALRRIQAQLPLAEKEAMADHLVVNDGSLEVLATRVGTLLSSLRKDTLCTEG